MKKITMILIIFFLSSLFIQADELKVIVTVEVANIRLKPSIESTVIEKAKIGQVLQVLQKVQDWYFVNLPPDKNGFVVSGYVHQSIVKVMTDEIPVQKEQPAYEERRPVAPPPPSKPAPVYKPYKTAKRKTFYIRAGAGYGSKTYSYTNNWVFTQYQEEGSMNESYSVDSSGLAYEAGLGFYFAKNIGVEVSFAPVSSKTKGEFSASFPHPLYFDNDRNVSWEKDDLGYAESEINLNLIVGFPVMEKLNVYFSGGGTYFLDVKAENLQQISSSEVGYPYLDINTTPTYNNYSKSGFGFNGGGGIDFFLMENIGLNLNVRYSMGKVKIDVEGTEIELKPGGLRATGGIKLAF